MFVTFKDSCENNKQINKQYLTGKYSRSRLKQNITEDNIYCTVLEIDRKKKNNFPTL